MPAVLEHAQPAQHDREPEMDVGGGRVDAELHPQRRAALDLGAQLGFGDDVDRVRGQELELPVDVHPGTVTNAVRRTGGIGSAELDAEAAVDGDDRTVHVRRSRQREVQHHVRDLFRVAVAPQRHAAPGELLLGVVGDQLRSCRC